jgi:hypothetical protein
MKKNKRKEKVPRLEHIITISIQFDYRARETRKRNASSFWGLAGSLIIAVGNHDRSHFCPNLQVLLGLVVARKEYNIV